jgi:hypothetical protein
MDQPSPTGGDKRFFRPRGFNGPQDTGNPDGWKTVTFKFQTFAGCKIGKDCPPNWYEGVKWEITRTWQDAAAGVTRPGKITVTSINYNPRPPPEFRDAYRLFNEKQGYKECTE